MINEELQTIIDSIKSINEKLDGYGIRILILSDSEFKDYIEQEERIKELEMKVEKLLEENRETSKVISSVLSQLSGVRKLQR